MIVVSAKHKDFKRMSEIRAETEDLHRAMFPDDFKTPFDAEKWRKQHAPKGLLNIFLGKARLDDFLVCKDGKTLLGYCHFVRLFDTESLWIVDLSVASPFRRQGVSTALVNEVAKIGHDAGLRKVISNVWVGNETSDAFHKKLKFQPRSVEHRVFVEQLLN